MSDVSVSWRVRLLSGVCAPEALSTVRCRWFGFAQSLVSLVETLALVSLDALPWVWGLSGRLIAQLPEPLAAWLATGPAGNPAATERAQSVTFTLLIAGEALLGYDYAHVSLNGCACLLGHSPRLQVF